MQQNPPHLPGVIDLMVDAFNELIDAARSRFGVKLAERVDDLPPGSDRLSIGPIRADFSEVADLELIKDRLKAIGLTDVESGLSDHGDPWFAFCDRDGRVLLHVARIGRAYHYDGIGISKPSIARRLEDVIAAVQTSRMAS